MKSAIKYVWKQVVNHLVSYPTPINFNYTNSFGSVLGVTLGIQILTGLLLAMHFSPHIALAFDSVEHIMRDVSGGWFLRYLHANGASMIFLLIYSHMGRGMFYQSYKNPRQAVWYTGCLLFVLMAATAFLGYVLPWGQMSYWAATVITNILTSIPFFGEPLVIWIWGGFSVNNATLNRFFALHFFVPFIIAGLAIVHILLLHRVGSSSPFGLDLEDIDYTRFYPYFFLKDLFSFLAFLTFYLFIVFFYPNLFGHPDNYVKANPLVTPSHIVPEWYFLPFYAILKSIPNKLAGAAAMAASMVVPFFLPKLDKSLITATRFKFFHGLFLSFFAADLMLLGWLGGRAPSAITMTLNQAATAYYFLHFVAIIPLLGKFENDTVEQYRIQMVK